MTASSAGSSSVDLSPAAGLGVRAPGDPRAREDGLGWVTRALFADDTWRVTIGRRPEPGALSWAVVPSVERARFLVPLGDRRVAAGSVLAYNALRAGPTRVVRAVIGAFARAGAVQALPFPVLSARAPTSMPAGAFSASAQATGSSASAQGATSAAGAPGGVGGGSLLGHLSAVLGEPVVAAIGVRPPDPNRKPTLQLFGADGRPRGYAKVGWNRATRALVRAESRALRGLPARPGAGHPLTPEPLYAGEWAGQEIAVTAPLPAEVRRLSDPDRPRLEAMLAVARRGGPAGGRVPLASFLRRLSTETDRIEDPHGTAIRAAVAALGARSAGVSVELGDWHGDWVPWNLGEVSASGAGGARLVAWDWEHSGAGVPVGFDLAHQAFNTALVVGGRPAAAAASAAVEALRRHGAALGLAPAAAEAVADAYLIEMWLRTHRLAAGGAGWNPDLHPALLEVLATRS